MLRWPDRNQVHEAALQWARELARREGSIIRRIGYVGSYARGDWGVGSDLDLVVIVSEGDPLSLVQKWLPTSLPVPADLLVYTAEAWEKRRQESKLFRKMADEAVWVYRVD